MFTCNKCGNYYSANKNLRKHAKRKHPEVLDVVAPVLKNSPTPEQCINVCGICDKMFALKSSLRLHKRNKHKIFDPKRKCQCSFCQHTSTSRSDLCKHYEDKHDVKIEIEQKEFDTFDSFQSWKIEMEKETKSRFVKARSEYKNANNVVTFSFHCHRSGHYVPSGKGERHLKTQGSNKIGGICPAGITLQQTIHGQLTIQYTRTHIGHKADVGHLVLDQQERDLLANNIAQKIPMEDILDKVRDSISNSNLDRFHLLTRKDLLNIERAYNLNSSAVRHQSDAVSVCAWVEEMEQSDSSPVLLFKPQGVFNEEYPQLKKDDFFLAIMNNAQCAMIKKYGNDCVCMDSTHGMNAYDFELTTLLVLDDLREGFPGAFLFSNRTDQEVIAVFLEVISEKTGKVSSQVFMSDIAESFYNAWVHVMGPALHRLYCTWHVDRAWRKNLTKVQTKEKQIEVYKLVRTLLQENDERAFVIMLKEALLQLCGYDDTQEFGIYFRDNYSCCSQAWAYCYRKQAGLNTNMHLERMHKTLKYIYLQGKTVKRLDKAIHSIMRFVRDKLIDRLIVLNRGKVTTKLSALRKRHKASLILLKESVIADTEGGIWMVQSSTTLGEVYSVEKMKDDCECKLKCDDCNACIHSYSCTCTDSSIKWNMCKHIHLVCQAIKSSSESIEEIIKAVDSEEDDGHLFIDCSLESNVAEYEAHLKQLSTGKQAVSCIESERCTLKSKLQEILTKVDNSKSIVELQTISKLIAPINPTLVAVSKNYRNIEPLDAGSFSKKAKEPANKSIQKQAMYSTKKKSSKKPRISKPSSSECQDIAMALLIPQYLSSNELTDLYPLVID